MLCNTYQVMIIASLHAKSGLVFSFTATKEPQENKQGYAEACSASGCASVTGTCVPQITCSVADSELLLSSPKPIPYNVAKAGGVH